MTDQSPSTGIFTELSLMNYTEEFANAEHEGYYWLLLPGTIMHFGNLFGGGGETPRVLVCKRCATVVGEISQHDEFHTALDMVKQALEAQEASGG